MNSPQIQLRRSEAVDRTIAADAARARYRRLRPGASLGLRRDACLPLNFSYLPCRRCEEACPVAALAVGSDSLQLTDACIGCGRCAAACPTGALRLAGYAVPDAVPAAAEAVHVDCWKVARADSPPDAVRVPCLGGLSTSQWLALVLAADGRPVIALDRGWCAGCSASAGAAHPAAAALEETRALLTDIGMCEAELPALEEQRLPTAKMPRAIPAADSEQPVKRRDFFGRLAREAAAAVAEARSSSPEAAEAPTPVRPGGLRAPERERRLGILALLAKRTGGAAPARLFAAVDVGDRCRNHQVCAALCPTGALRGYHSGGTAGIAFHARACIACGACERGCPENALRLVPHRREVQPAELAPLTRHRLRECAACGRAFAGSGDVCAPCRKSRALLQGVFASPVSGGAPAPGPDARGYGEAMWNSRTEERQA